MINYSIEVIILDSWEEDTYTSKGYKRYILIQINNELSLREGFIHE